MSKRGYHGMFESSNLSMDNLSGEIGHRYQPDASAYAKHTWEQGFESDEHDE